MTGTAPSLSVAYEVEPERLPLPAQRLEHDVLELLRAAPFPGSLSLAVVDDATMRRINRDHHATDAATDVLAFPLRSLDADEPARPGEFDAEVVVSLDTALREAEARGLDAGAELLLYVTHGVLHLLGYDDHDEDEARRMHERTLDLLDALGWRSRIDGIDHDSGSTTDPGRDA